ncbi:MAG TPA: type II/IV secretion system protein [Persephonella sp.]|uniref:Type IV pilus assembly protein TapB n=1 Tax=Persephonella marina (strain DSM 14350 / EX-H1) TaxID=123214 RepID=C0QTJ0_PERMH|nr:MULTISPECIES: GspE/PulE family protein [Persephonella]ACO04598.1 type IV pilus assembly protein TapB [Persephonella marina EX-H1]HCB70378.1 type II/IV secretion system protein [Persephonella sp.]
MSITIKRKIPDKSFIDLIVERLGLQLEDIKKYQSIAKKENKNLLQVLIEHGYSEEDIAKIKAEYFGYKYDRLTNYVPPEEITEIFSKKFLMERYVLPLKFDQNVLILAMVEPTDVITINEVIEILKQHGYDIKEVNIIITTKKQILEKIELLYEEKRKLEEILKILQVEEKEEFKFEHEEDITEKSSPIIMLAHRIIEDAYKKNASDIHIQPTEANTRIRMRIDGDLVDYLNLPKFAHEPLITRYKIMANMKIDEKRVPQDARINFARFNPAIDIDLRVSTVPTVYGEDLVMRLLDKSSVILDLDKLGFSENHLKLYRETIRKPYGIILHVGPTGSGKTTTLYSALKEIDTPEKKIITVEDPVEYTLGGSIVQTNINPAAGYTFAKAIKSFLRHDPDVMLVGEIRDIETAKIAVEASLTGHLVFSTLHTNDAVSTITRLEEMGIESYLLADSLLLICAQRLVKKICNSCKTAYIPSKKEEIVIKNAGFEINDDLRLYKGSGCKVCNFTGYKGRTGIHELLKVDSDIKNMLIERESTEKIKAVALEKGMKTLRQDAVEKALRGITTIDEVIRVTLE